MEPDQRKRSGSWRCAHAYRQTRNDSDLQVYGWVRLFYLIESSRHQFDIIGTSIYFLSPRWPYTVNLGISLDYGPINPVNLEHSRPDAGRDREIVAYAVVWMATELANVQHTVVVSVLRGQPHTILNTLDLRSAFCCQLLFFFP